MVLVEVMFDEPAAGNVITGGIAGIAASVGVPVMLPPEGAGPLYVVPVGCVTLPDMGLPALVVFPLTLMLPFIDPPDPIVRIVPDAFCWFAAEMFPATVLPFAN